MRFHRAIRVSRRGAAEIRSNPVASRNDCALINHDGKWYDVREMTEKELADFVEDLAREEYSAKVLRH